MMTKDVLISKETFDEYFDMAKGCVTDRIAEAPTGIAPHLLVWTTTEDKKHELAICVIAADFNEHDEKRECLESLGLKFFKEKKIPVCVAFWSEAWQAKIKASEVRHIQPRDCPDKFEAIVVVAMSILGKHCRMASIPVRRDDVDRIFPDGEFSGPPDGAKVESNLLMNFYRGFAGGLFSGGVSEN